MSALEMDGISRLIQDPLLVLDIQGRVLEYNKYANALLDAELTESGPRVFEDDESFRALMEMASGTSEPVIGAVTFRSASQLRRFRVRALCIDRSKMRVAVQILDTRSDQFNLLSKRVRELNREITERRAVQARLEETLARNSMLFQELQHRVKNHLQMILGLFSVARRETSKPEEAAFLTSLEAKLKVVFEAQQLMYVQASNGVRADQLLGALVSVAAALAPQGVQIDVQADPVTISNEQAFPVALIANELLSNAVKYGAPGGAGRICATLRSAGDDLEFQVRDWGPGFVTNSSNRRSSGLGLVRGLCRQIGGRFDIRSDDGTIACVRFPVES